MKKKFIHNIYINTYIHIYCTYIHYTSGGRYWMYAAVKAGPEGLLISNDEMRDHMFQLLAPRFFHKWKQRHQASVGVFCLPLACNVVHCLSNSVVTAQEQASDVAVCMHVHRRPFLTGTPGHCC